MGFISTGLSAITKLAALGILLMAFIAGLAGVVYMSLSGTEIKVPEIVGKDFIESEKELAALGLKIKRRADRASTEKINTVLEQLPKPGETVKTGQMILVVVSKAGATADETPKSLIKDIEADDTEKIEEMITDKPKRKLNSNSNANAKKKADTTRDTIANTASGTDVNTDITAAPENSNKKETETKTDKPKSNPPAGPGTKPQQAPSTTKPAAGEQRPRSTKP
jgi:beta-lactam-binding protein with PASTA domain